VTRRALWALLIFVAAGACGRGAPPAAGPTTARNLVVITIDTLRADRVGAYGYAAARTPAIDALAGRGVLFERAFAVAPITLTSHASLMTGRYPPGHGARHNGMRMDAAVPTLAETLAKQGFATGAFVAAFPLDKRFGLHRGFETYGDRLPRGPSGRPQNEREGRLVVDEALAWLDAQRGRRFFLWVHLFEPHAPYGNPADGRPAQQRYDDEVAEADRQVGRIVHALRTDAAATVIAVMADHGEAFGEHGEIGHSLFVYDTTLQVPLILAGGPLPHTRVAAPVSMVDVAATVLPLLGAGRMDTDGTDLDAAIRGAHSAPRALYAESFAPLLDFGWSPLRTLREDGWKYVAAPRQELYRIDEDRGEARDVASAEPTRAAAMRDKLARYSSDTLDANLPTDPESRARLQALGYVGGGATTAADRPDPKDRKALAAEIARVTSGEVQGAALEAALRRILASDPLNPQANLRLGYVLQESGKCADAVPHFRRAIAARLPGADPYLGLATCEAAARRVDAAIAALRDADRAEPDNPVVSANLGILLSDDGRPADGVPHLERAIGLDPDFHQARFNLAVALARLGRRQDAARQAEELLRRLPPGAPQRGEVQRLIDAVR
jgi:arylsulfatase A-like enzyme/cytochrome c-type biogenesis protein CcmH/NrfG